MEHQTLRGVGGNAVKDFGSRIRENLVVSGIARSLTTSATVSDKVCGGIPPKERTVCGIRRNKVKRPLAARWGVSPQTPRVIILLLQMRGPCNFVTLHVGSKPEPPDPR